MTGPHPHRFGDILRERGFVTEDQLREALRSQATSRRRLGEILLDMGVVTQEQLNWALSERLGIPYVEFGDEVVDLDLARSMPEEVLRRHEAVPVLRVGDELTVILTDPTNRQAAVELEALTGARVQTAMTSRERVLHLLDKAFPPGPEARGRRRDVRVPAPSAADADMTGVAPVYGLLLGALREEASEIHVEPGAQDVRVRNRVAGCLVERARLPRELLGPVNFRLRVLAGLRGESAPRLAHVRTQLEGQDVELEMLFFPTLHGEAVTVRMWRRTPGAPTLDGLELAPEDRDVLASMTAGAAGRGGLVFVTGWEARVRATLLYALAGAAAGPARKAVTIERAASFVVPEFLQVELPDGFPDAAATVLAHPTDVALVEDVAAAPVCAAAFGCAEQGALVVGGLGFATNRRALDHLLALDVPRAALLAVTRGLVHARRQGPGFVVEALPMTDALREELLARGQARD